LAAWWSRTIKSVAHLLQTLLARGFTFCSHKTEMAECLYAAGRGKLGSGSSGAGTTPAADSARPASVQRLSLLATLRYGSANFLLVLGAAALVIGGWAIWGVLALALVFGSFADEVSGDDDTSLKESRCIFCTVNLYLTLPLVGLLAFLLVRFAALRPSLTEQPLETIGALWLTGYLFALAGATVAHELTHRSNRLAKLSAYLLLGFTGNASFVIYHIYTHHRQVGTYHDAATARRGERLRTFMARTLTQQFAQAARFEAARLKRKGLSPYSWRNELILAHLVPLAILVLAGIFRRVERRDRNSPRRSDWALVSRAHQLRGALWVGARRKFADHAASQLGLLSNPLERPALQFAATRRPSYVRQQSVLAVERPARRADIALWLPNHGLHRAHPAALAPHHEEVARRLG
jgi:hypothetical protein